jgi:ankyrin repeat protein
LHENPASERGKQKSELNYMLVQSPQSAPPGFQAEHELHAAAQAGDTATLLSIADGPGYVDLNAQDSRGWTALHYAAAGGHASTIRVLAGRGPRLAVPTVNDETPLVLAVDNGHQDAVCELVEAGADVNDFAPRGPSPLVTAARRDDKEMVRLLLCLGADPSLADGYSIMPLLSGIHARDNAANDDDDDDRVLTELLDAGADVNALAPSTGVGAIGFAAHQGNVRAARMLLARGAGPDGNPALPPPLQQALDDRNAAMVEALLEHGAQVSGPGVRFRDGWSAMMWAAAAGDVPIGRLLHGRDPDLLYAAGGKEKWTPLHVAAAKGNTFFAKLIREESKKSGHRWDERDYKGRTASQLRNGDE